MNNRVEKDVDALLRLLEPGHRGILPGSMPETVKLSDTAAMVAADIAQAAPDAVPPAGLFARIEQEIDVPPIPGISTIAATNGKWSDQGMGVWCKLMASPPEGKNIYLLRCLPGGVIPAHKHSGWEYALVLEGRFQTAGRVLRAGDGQYSAPDSHHPEITTDIGCLLLVVA